MFYRLRLRRHRCMFAFGRSHPRFWGVTSCHVTIDASSFSTLASWKLARVNSIFSYICLPVSGIWSLIAREEISLHLCSPVWKVILGRDIEGNLSGSKRVTMDNFSISVKGWWKMIISHLKHSYLNWRANPCRRKMIAVFHHFFNTFFFWIWLSWFSFGLNRIFQVHDMTINFSFCSFFLFSFS